MQKLVKPNSALWQLQQQLKGYMNLQPRLKKLCTASTYSDKVTMLGIVEATFGGQQGYLNDIVKRDLHTPNKSALALEIDKMVAYRAKRKDFDNNRWREMYER